MPQLDKSQRRNLLIALGLLVLFFVAFGGVRLFYGLASLAEAYLFHRYTHAKAFLFSLGNLFAGGILGGAVVLLSGRALATHTKRRLKEVGGALLGFGLLCLLSAVGLTMRPALDEVHLAKEVSPTGGLIGPITFPVDSTNAELTVRQQISRGSGRTFQRWSFVNASVFDANKEYLIGFGFEFWRYAGVDEDGYYWHDHDSRGEVDLEFPSPGPYYLRLETESNVDSTELDRIEVRLNEWSRRAWWGSPLPLRAAGHLGFLIGAMLFAAAVAAATPSSPDEAAQET